ncbi:MAG: PilZ domain-containing protein, partial [Candidatus Methylomirabilales bacterium]
VQLVLPEAVPVGTRHHLSLQVPMGPRALEGEVVWCAPAERGEHRVGVRFPQDSWAWSFLLDLAEREGGGPDF